MKVYCRDCKWSDIAWITRCFDIGDLVAEPGKVFTQEEIQESANSNNDCLGYKRKWWKFWVA